MSPTAIRFLKSAFLVATDGLAGLQEFAGNATGLYYTTDEAHEGSHGVPREAGARLPRSTRAAPEHAQRDRGARPAPAAPAARPRTGSGSSPRARDAAGGGRRRSLVGLGAALAVGAPFRLDTALGCLAVALLLQVAANFANDLSDFRRGADTRRPARARCGSRPPAS